MRSRLLLPVLLLGLAAPACDQGGTNDPEGASDEAVGSVVPPGKADNFYSASAQEYVVEGRTTITLGSSWADASLEEQREEVERLIPYKQVVVGWFLNALLVDKSDDDPNGSYGGYKALTKNGAYEDADLQPVDGEPLTWAFTIRQELGGQFDLLSALEGARSVGPDVYEFDLWIGRISNSEMQELDTDREWYRRSPWSSFDPSTVDEDRKTQQTLTIRPQPRSDDAYIDYERLFADDFVSVGIHFGWDYHNAYHEVHSKSVYDWLVDKGFEAPASWEELSHDAGPLTGQIQYDGRTIDVEVSLFWGRSGDASDPDTAAGGRQLEEDMLDSLANREVVMFSGHSGPFYGFALANWRKTSEGDLDDSELDDVQLNEGVYQVIVAEGCDTYAIGQAFRDNPSKPGMTDMDVITTTSYSNASTAGTVLDIVGAVIGERYDDEVEPTTWDDLLRDLDGNSYWFTTMYGVHGIDDNPTVHPLADPAMACGACSSHSDCGEGMKCVAMSDGTKACGAVCTASRDCGEGYDCRNVQVDGWLSYKTCVPNTLSCEVPVDEEPRLLVNEILADPAPGAEGDANGDGERHASRDEFLELINAGAAELDLSGWTISDRVMVRHVFPEGTVLPPGGALVVFGGGEVDLVAGTTLFQTASTGMLGMNNSGDAIRIGDLDGNILAEVSYDREGGEDMALVRTVDGDPEAAFVQAPPTPGTKSDGSQF
ncbi:MAG: lamin tail domain-containing protein [Myxococcota bacterium]